MPYVGRDMMAFPVSLPADGLLDITVQELVCGFSMFFCIYLIASQVPRPLMVKMISGAENGDQFWLPSVWIAYPDVFLNLT